MELCDSMDILLGRLELRFSLELQKRKSYTKKKKKDFAVSFEDTSTV